MKYELKLEGESGIINLANIGKNDSIIKSADFLIEQANMATNDKSDQLFHTLVVKGEITDKSKKATKELLDWSMTTKQSEIYKNVTLKITQTQTELIRDYYIKDMFCVSYREYFDDSEGSDEKADSSKGSFILKMRQRKGSIETIKVNCN